jgi:hypothetical protein
MEYENILCLTCISFFCFHTFIIIIIIKGCNIGIPVPREPFSFGGLYGTKSKYGTMDITGDGSIEFFTNRIKISKRWPLTISNDIIGTPTSLNSDNSNNNKNTITKDTVDTTITSNSNTSTGSVEIKDAANFTGSM